MKRIAPILLALLVAPAVQAAPFAKGDAKAGQAMHDKQCAGC
ncbi:MAG: cytochrome c, partial [Thiobacillus sp.]|nr:cytochrome c [Thiobacillus sp.]